MPKTERFSENVPFDASGEMSFFNEEFLTITINKKEQWLHSAWKGYQTEASIMAGFEKILEALQTFGLKKVLNNNTGLLGIWTPAASWVGTNWLPRMHAAGLQHLAWVYSSSRLSQVSTNECISTTPLPHLIHTFNNLEEATAWLQSAV